MIQELPENSGRGKGFLNLASHTDISEQHKFLDKAVRFALLLLFDVDRL